jgi:hypothetical protein
MKAIWVHADCLHRESPAYLAYPDAPSIFVFDDAGLARDGWTLKRIGFVYECLLDLPVVIRRGDPVRVVRQFAEENQCAEIVTMATPDPHLQAQAAELNAEVLPQAPFVELRGKVDLTRFSRYWNKAEKALGAGR